MDIRSSTMEGALFEGLTPAGKHVYICPLTYGRARVTLGPDEMFWDDGW